MSYFIRIFGQATDGLSRRDIQEWIVGGLHFDKVPVFIPAFLDPDSMLEDWESLIIIYAPDTPTVNLMRHINDAVFQAEQDAVKALIGKSVSNELQQQLIEMVEASNQVIGIEIDREYLSEEAWAMLDALEAYLAGNLMGLVYAPEDGFYGSGLELLHKIG
ncbi:MAG: hypothetical protein H0X30_31425 [Anaerolineae bacterium]|nr:hypothetical protein [Anaerolineae bacterium]